MFKFTTDWCSNREQLLKQPTQVIGRMIQISDAAKVYGLTALLLLIYFHAVC